MTLLFTKHYLNKCSVMYMSQEEFAIELNDYVISEIIPPRYHIRVKHLANSFLQSFKKAKSEEYGKNGRKK